MHWDGMWDSYVTNNGQALSLRPPRFWCAHAVTRMYYNTDASHACPGCSMHATCQYR